eukprot:TRINITY_DN67947_c1_g1_i1.p1 TRINITY_DN67947_c1_g1~~TRINITY_DN67947_c1_g1_i1.p1  ORF type:complete len:150 (-),score=21.80 TRINITY_DN67947_c1_g1_i1:613-1017(-)
MGDDAMRAFFQGQMSGSIPMQLQLDKNEFSRKPDPSASATAEQQAQVLQALETAMTSGLYRFGGTCRVIAAQFKNANMKQSELSPAVIEAALTYLCDHLKEHSSLASIANISYSDDGAGLYGDGVRVFSIGKAN